MPAPLPEKLLVVCPNWVGDAVMATPTLRALRCRFPDAEMAFLARPAIAETLAELPYPDRWIIWDRGGRRPQYRTWHVLRQIRRGRFDLGVLLSNSFRTALLLALGGVRRRIVYGRDGRSWLLSDRLAPRRERGRFVPYPVIDYYLELAYHLGCPLESYRLELATGPADERAADQLWQFCRLDRFPLRILLNPGAAYGEAKCWPAEYFAQLARMLAQRCGAGVLVLCGPNEVTLARQIVETAQHSAVFTVADFRPSIGLSKACVRRADLLITTDSGPRHFAAAFDVPVVTIFGPTHQAWSETYFAKAIHLQCSVPCGPCQLKRCPTDQRCMRELTPQQVFQATMQAIERFGRRAKPATG